MSNDTHKVPFSLPVNVVHHSISNYVATEPISTEVNPTPQKEQNRIASGIAPWGKDNKFPTELDSLLEHSPDMESGFQSLTEFASGIRLSTSYAEMKGGELSISPCIDPDFEDFRTNYNFEEAYLQRAFYNYFRYANVFAEFSLNTDKMVSRIFTKDSPWGRISTLNKSTGISDSLFLSSEWDTLGYSGLTESRINELVGNKSIDKIPLIDYRNPIDFIRKAKDYRLGWHIKDYSPGNAYYGQSPWYPILYNGWLDIAKSAPSLLQAYYKNLFSGGQHVELDEDWVKQECGGKDFDNLSTDEKKKRITNFQLDFEKKLVGAPNSFKTIFSFFRKGPRDTTDHQIKINPIINPSKDGKIIDDLKYASSICQSALRMDDSLTGNKTTGSLEADAGSEKRMAGNLLNARLAPVRNQILYPLTIIKKINKWDPRLQFNIEWNYLVTTDQSKSGQMSKNP